MQSILIIIFIVRVCIQWVYNQGLVYFAFILPIFLSGNFFSDQLCSRFCSKFNISLKLSYIQLASLLLNSDITATHQWYVHQLHIHIINSYSYTDYELVIQLCGIYKCQFLTRSNVLIVLLEYIDLSQSKWQYETNIWEGLPCPLPFYIAVFHSKQNYYNYLSIFCSNCSYYARIFLCFCLRIIPIILLAKSMHPYIYNLTISLY